jgi:hypothetical protein
MANFSGFERYITICKESVFNTYPGSPTNVYVPVSDYSVAIQNTFVQSELYTGLYDGTHNQATLANITGSLSCPLWTHTVATKPVAQWLIDWALNRPSGSYLDSYSVVAAEVAAGTTRKQTGMTVNTMTIAGTNGQLCTIALDLVGAGETGITTGIPAIPETGTSATPFAVNFTGYGGVTPGVEMYINSGSASTVATTADSIRSFNLVVNNNTTPYFTNSYYASTIGAGKRAVSFNFTLFKYSNTWDVLRRSANVNEFHIELKLRGPDGSGGYNVINFEFERVSFAGATDTYAMNAFTEQGIAMMALKPAYTGHSAIQVTYTTEP